jgi:hypothetical protein
MLRFVSDELPGDPDKRDAELTRMIRQAKAEAAVRAVSAGENPTLAAFVLANEFTDNLTYSIGKRLRRLLRRDR